MTSIPPIVGPGPRSPQFWLDAGTGAVRRFCGCTSRPSSPRRSDWTGPGSARSWSRPAGSSKSPPRRPTAATSSRRSTCPGRGCSSSRWPVVVPARRHHPHAEARLRARRGPDIAGVIATAAARGGGPAGRSSPGGRPRERPLQRQRHPAPADGARNARAVPALTEEVLMVNITDPLGNRFTVPDTVADDYREPGAVVPAPVDDPAPDERTHNGDIRSWAERHGVRPRARDDEGGHARRDPPGERTPDGVRGRRVRRPPTRDASPRPVLAAARRHRTGRHRTG